MQYDAFIDRVMAEGSLDDRERAVEMVQVVLDVLGERLYRTERNGLAAQLPNELQGFLNTREEPGPTRRDVDMFTLDEFYNRVSARSGAGLPEVRRQTRVVLAVLAEAVSRPVLEEALSQVSQDIRSLI